MISQESLDILNPLEIQSLITGLPIDVIRKLIAFEKDRINQYNSVLGASQQDDEDIVRIAREGYIKQQILDSILYFFENLKPPNNDEGDF